MRTLLPRRAHRAHAILGGVVSAVAVAAAAGLTGCSASSKGHLLIPASSAVRRPGAQLPPGTPPASTVPTDTTAPGGTTTAAGCTGACFTDPAGVSVLLSAATADITAANSYDYRHLGHALAAGLAASSGAYQDRYRHALTTVIAPAARRLHAAQQATVSSAGVENLDPGARTATVLAAGTLHITADNTGPGGRTDPFQVEATMTQTAGKWLISNLTPITDGATGTAPADPPGSPALTEAQLAGDQEVANLGTYARATFDSDFRRALAGTTGGVRADLLQRKAALRQALARSGSDEKTYVAHSAVVSADGDQVTLLASVTTTHGPGAATASAGPTAAVVTVMDVDGEWLISDVRTVGTP